jgi:hypothetical protein
MLNFCLPSNLVNEFLARVKSGEINPERLTDMTSQQRREYFTSFLGDLNAHKVNAMFEEKILLKNQQAGLIKWAKQLAGVSKVKERAFINKVNNMKDILQPKEVDAYLEDLVSQRLGLSVSVEEAKILVDLSQEVAYRKSLITPEMPARSTERIHYGVSLYRFKETVSAMKREANELTPQEFLVRPGKWVETVGGTAKSLLSSLDNSFFGRQGFVTLANHPEIWAKNFIQSWGDIGKELKGVDAMVTVKADVFSRENAINGKYQAIGIDIGIETEEAFPPSKATKIPLLGRVFKASESAYSAAALRFRADLADLYIKQYESMGGQSLKESGLGVLINSMTGRGHLHLTPGQAKFVNVTFFSVKWIKANLDLLSLYQLDTKMDPKIRAFAARKALQPILLIAATLAIAKLLDPDSVEDDPRSTDFGSIVLGGYKINISLGVASLVTIASRIQNKNIKTSRGRIMRIGTKKYGNAGWEDLLLDYFEGKTSPLFKNLNDMWYEQHFGGEKVTVGSIARNMTVPLPVQQLGEMVDDKENANTLFKAILGALSFSGISVSKKKTRRR